MSAVDPRRWAVATAASSTDRSSSRRSRRSSPRCRLVARSDMGACATTTPPAGNARDDVVELLRRPSRANSRARRASRAPAASPGCRPGRPSTSAWRSRILAGTRRSSRHTTAAAPAHGRTGRRRPVPERPAAEAKTSRMSPPIASSKGEDDFAAQHRVPRAVAAPLGDGPRRPPCGRPPPERGPAPRVAARGRPPEAVP